MTRNPCFGSRGGALGTVRVLLLLWSGGGDVLEMRVDGARAAYRSRFSWRDDMCDVFMRIKNRS